ncbi:hypothetical protein NIIDNTM18_38120 [Mycolicibacterium litorale]|uniref:Uncharacterized protein n=2 Tax=Mycolicibacterium litorale TaxID=758802 RepID=A0A6S6P7G1_9MYCO|nr:hypothetical protein NIIDNTM18_38120 [Mycolicibacterium litorale]
MRKRRNNEQVRIRHHHRRRTGHRIPGLRRPRPGRPSGPGNAADTISSLDDRGYQVRVTQQGMNKPLDESSIVSVRYDNDKRIVYVTTR